MRKGLLSIVTILLAATPLWGQGEPTRITLHLKDATPHEIFSELSRQSGCAFVPKTSDLWKKAVTPVTVDIDAQPFWSAMRDISAKTGLYPSLLELRKQTIAEGTLSRLGPTQVQGSFLVVASHASKVAKVDFADPGKLEQELAIQLLVLPEPNLRVQRGAKQVHVQEALDEKGNTLSLTESTIGGRDCRWTIDLKFQMPPGVGQRIAKLKGSARFTVQSSNEKWEIDDILNAGETTRTIATHAITMAELKQTAATYALRIIAPMAFPFDVNDFILVDAQGNALVYKGGTKASDSAKKQMEYVLNYARAANGTQPAAGEPAKFIWYLTGQPEDVTVPIDFVDLPLP